MKGELENQDLFRRELDRLQQMIDELFMLATKDEQDENEPFLRELLHPDGLLQEVFETFQPIAWRERRFLWNCPCWRVTGRSLRILSVCGRSCTICSGMLCGILRKGGWSVCQQKRIKTVCC